METVLRAIAEPRRRAILSLVHERELSAGEIAGRFDVSWPAISQHLGVLRDAGLLTERRDGRRRLYRSRPEGLAEVVVFLDSFWEARLDALRTEAEAEARTRARTRGPDPSPDPSPGPSKGA